MVTKEDAPGADAQLHEKEGEEGVQRGGAAELSVSGVVFFLSPIA